MVVCAVFLRWVLTLHRGRCLVDCPGFVRLLGYWRMGVLGDLALLNKAWHADFMFVLESGVDLPSRIFLHAVKTYIWPRYIGSQGEEYANAVLIAKSMWRWKPRKVMYLRGKWEKESASVLYWGDGTVKKITSTWRDKDPGCRVALCRHASEPAITVAKPSWEGGSRDTAQLDLEVCL